MKFNSGKLGLIGSFLFMTLVWLEPAISATNCYRLSLPERPEPASSIEIPSEIWCYERLAYPVGSVYIYNADGNEVRPELAMVVDADGLLTHGSLAAGEVTIHSIHSSVLNPFSIPVDEPMHSESVQIETALFEESANSVLKALLQQRSAPEGMLLEPGTFSASVPSNRLPWRGFWWPWKKQTISNGPDSPLGKYDQFVQSRTGQNPNSVAWENDIHKGDEHWWKGHCNGWAASAILREQPRKTKKDPQTGMKFTVSDQKGLLAETDYCAKISYYGKRYRGNPGDDIKDVYPDVFHKTLTYYVGELKKPFPFDYYPDKTVDNHVVSGYTLRVQKISPNTYRVNARLKMHKYDSRRINNPGTAPSYYRSYSYTLKVDSAGQIIGGEWISSKNPDYMWVPLAVADCSLNNPRMTHQWVATILDLPSN